MTSKQDGNILTFLRIKPSKSPSGYFATGELEVNSLTFTLPQSKDAKDYVNNTKLAHGFHFNGILDATANQEDVFKKVGTAAVQNAIDGFNSTIFAYGQTGSGKTFTLTGGPDSYADRGIIPRAISMLFKEFRARAGDIQFKVKVSYLELYNEQGYDLLDGTKDNKTLEELPKVILREDMEGNYELKNLKTHLVESEEAALDLLFLGDTNRAIAETPMNMASSRSHCIFTLSIEGQPTGSDVVRRSKLNLVDLAGSERVAKTNSSGSVLTEAKYINTSLFYLESVIVALYEKATKGRDHIPYRNSMMTSVLRDSLGGNCKTIMIATINPEASHTEESLSTCKFAQRVSMIKNRALINEELDPALMVKRLKGEVLALREEVAFLKGESGDGDALSPQALEDLKEQCRNYCDIRDAAATLNIGALTLTKIKDSFAILKNLVLEARAAVGSKQHDDDGETPATKQKYMASEEALCKQIRDLKSQVLQRDTEINILVNMVKQGKTSQNVMSDSGGSNYYSRDNDNHSDNSRHSTEYSNDDRRSVSQKAPFQSQPEAKLQSDQAKLIKRHLFGVPPPADPHIFDDAAASFEWFKERCDLNKPMRENQELLKARITEAKAVGEKANTSRSTITYLKNSIEAIRRERALQAVGGGDKDDGAVTDSADEVTYKRAIEQEKIVYKENFDRLKTLKPEIEHITKIIHRTRDTQQTQFDQWYTALHSRTGANLVAMTTHSSGYLNSGASNATEGPSHLSAQSKLNFESSARTTNEDKSMNRREWKDDINSQRHEQNSTENEDDVNEHINAFYQAKDDLLKRRQGGH